MKRDKIMARIHRDKRSLIVDSTFVNWKTGELVSPVETDDYTVIQVAESCFIGGFETGAHRQLCDLEMTLVLTGSLISSADGRYEKVEKNSAYLSFRGEMHSLYSKTSCRFLTLAVNFKESSSDIYTAARDGFLSARTQKNADPLSVLPRIASEFTRTGRAHFQKYLNALITELLVSLLRETDENEKMTKQTTDELILSIADYIDANYLKICSAEELCKMGYTYNYICKLFRDAYGTTPGEYIFEKRMDHAKRCLEEGKKVSEISHTLGYSSPYNFSRAFKRHFGSPPSKLQKKEN